VVGDMNSVYVALLRCTLSGCQLDAQQANGRLQGIRGYSHELLGRTQMQNQ
jgi:hypothetical protein